MLWQTPLPEKYRRMSGDELAAAIRARKAELGDQLIILGHHYQQDEVVQHADFTGDSFKLSQLAAQKVREKGSKYVIFCGVHFMAESADILAPEGTVVMLPDLSAGCSMADMAAYDDVVDAWEQIHEVIGASDQKYRVIPITYMNSSAAIKAFVGEHGGAVCTSSNAKKVLQWAFAGGSVPRTQDERIKVLFFPDQHLGRNTAADMGYDVEADMCVWDPRTAAGLGGNTQEKIIDAAVLLWKGHCSVHKLFRPEHVDQLKANDPDMTVIVHPECIHEVVQKADLSGSTEGIIKAVRDAAPGTRWAIGTEVHLVQRIAKEAAERGVSVRILSDCQCLCTTMYRINQPHLLWTLDNLAEGRIVNQVNVEPAVKQHAMVALQRMLDITAEPEAPVVQPAGGAAAAAIAHKPRHEMERLLNEVMAATPEELSNAMNRLDPNSAWPGITVVDDAVNRDDHLNAGDQGALVTRPRGIFDFDFVIDTPVPPDASVRPERYIDDAPQPQREGTTK